MQTGRIKCTQEIASCFLQCLSIVNILICCTVVIVIAWWQTLEFDHLILASIVLTAVGFAGTTFVQSKPNLREGLVFSGSITVLGLIALATGIEMPINTSFAATLPSSLATAGAMLLFAMMMMQLMRKRGNERFVMAWQTMARAIIFVPTTAAFGTMVFIVSGWPFSAAFSAAFLGSLFLNPLIAYWLIIHAGP